MGEEGCVVDALEDVFDKCWEPEVEEVQHHQLKCCLRFYIACDIVHADVS